MTDQTDPLAGLKGLHLPESITELPLAVGWWIVLIVTVSLLLFGQLLVTKWLNKHRYRRLAMQQFSILVGEFEEHKDDIRLLTSINQLLKSVVIQQCPEVNRAVLQGEQWQHFLHQSLAGVKNLDIGSFLALQGIYQKSLLLTSEQRQELIRCCKVWLKQHRLVNSATGIKFV
jgi:hypothetical protein